MKTFVMLLLVVILGPSALAAAPSADLIQAFCERTLVGRALDRRAVGDVFDQIPEGRIPLYRPDGAAGAAADDAVEVRRLPCGMFGRDECLGLKFFSGDREVRRATISPGSRNLTALLDSSFVALVERVRDPVVARTKALGFARHDDGSRSVMLIEVSDYTGLTTLGHRPLVHLKIFADRRLHSAM